MLQAILLAGALHASQVAIPLRHDKVIPELREAIASSDGDETYKVYAVLGERLSYADFQGEVESLPRGVRQQHVEDRLRAYADARQGALLGLLRSQEAEGRVENIRQLWITNSVIFTADATVIEEVASLPEVAYIGWTPDRDPSEIYDAPCPTPAPGGFTTYFSEDFESGMPGGTAMETTGCGQVIVTGLYGPYSGTGHLVLGATADSCDSTAVITFKVDLTGVTTAKLRFAFKDMNDEFDAGSDVVEVTDNGGLSWQFVGDLTGSDGSYQFKEYDLDATGISYGSGFRMRFRWKDNFAPETDGFGFDELEIADGFEPPPPPGPEPNLVQLQATDLWAMGINGAGTVLLNIDDGTDLDHPDLINRIWINPNDPVDGIDNDLNGYVDDINGWDFGSNDNDPDGGSHGTSTAGIMVGDGSSGLFQTGMAPGASLAVAKIAGEANHWEALQYGVSVGVDASSSSHSWKWYFSPKPDYHMHRSVSEMVLAAGIIHANSIGNSGGSTSAPVPFNISAPGLCPAPWRHTGQIQPEGGVGGTMGCGAIELNDSVYSFSSNGPSAWENIQIYDSGYPFGQNPLWFDYPVGGFSGGMQGLIKPDVVTYTNVATTTLGGGFTSAFGGTSAATPHLGGAFCLLLNAQPLAQPRHIAQALMRSAEDLGAPGKDNQFGAGKVQVLDAAMRLFHLVTASDQTPSIGSSFNIAVDGEAGDFYAALWSLGQGESPTPVGSIDLAAPFWILNVSALDGTGHDDMPITLPNDPGLIGTEVFVQSIEDNSGGALGAYLFSVVENLKVSP